MTIVEHNILKLKEIKNLLEQLPLSIYIQPKEILSGSTIGQHFRHILEFYICLEKGTSTEAVCYDERERDVLIETNIEYTFDVIDNLILFAGKIKKDDALILKANYSTTSDEKLSIQTSLFRELAYTLDHAVHHLAIVKIALTEDQVKIDSNFGIAPSTIRHRKVLVQ